MAAGEALIPTAKDITSSIKDCKSSKEKVEASPCAADIEFAGEDLADATTMVLAAIKTCSDSDKNKCVQAVSEVVQELGTASKDIAGAVSDCGGASTKCAQDISDAAKDLADATDDVSKAIDDCASSSDSDCIGDIMAAGEQLGLTGVAIDNSLKDCKSFTTEQSIIQ